MQSKYKRVIYWWWLALSLQQCQMSKFGKKNTVFVFFLFVCFQVTFYPLKRLKSKVNSYDWSFLINIYKLCIIICKCCLWFKILTQTSFQSGFLNLKKRSKYFILKITDQPTFDQVDLWLLFSSYCVRFIDIHFVLRKQVCKTTEIVLSQGAF